MIRPWGTGSAGCAPPAPLHPVNCLPPTCPQPSSPAPHGGAPSIQAQAPAWTVQSIAWQLKHRALMQPPQDSISPRTSPHLHNNGQDGMPTCDHPPRPHLEPAPPSPPPPPPAASTPPPHGGLTRRRHRHVRVPASSRRHPPRPHGRRLKHGLAPTVQQGRPATGGMVFARGRGGGPLLAWLLPLPLLLRRQRSGRAVSFLASM